MEAGLRLIENGLFNMKDLITHEFTLDEVDQAYEAIATKPPGFIKSVIRVD
jgi:threonine dehydrogenase-like Zn-dependent dehydrogenase